MTSVTVKLEYPWTQWYKYGVLCYDRRDNSGRRYIELRHGIKKFKTTYARYLYAVHLGEMVPKELYVDHINNDCTDDRIENYQLLTPIENTKKYHLYNKPNILKNHKEFLEPFVDQHNIIIQTNNLNLIKIKCCVCGKHTTVNYYNFKRKKIKDINSKIYCSKKCFGNSISILKDRPELPDEITRLALDGNFTTEIAKKLNINRRIVEKYTEAPILKNNGRNDARRIKNEMKNKIKELAKQGKNPSLIANTLGLNRGSVVKYAGEYLVFGVKNNRNIPFISYKKPSDEKINLMTDMIKQGMPPAVIGRKLKVGYDTVLKYSKVPVPNYTHAPKNNLSKEIIDKINEYPERVTDSDIAKLLNITVNSVVKYRKVKQLYKRGVTDNFKSRCYKDQETINKIIELEQQGFSYRKIARLLGISRYTIEKQRKNTNIGTKELSIMSEMIFYRKKAMKVALIRDLLDIGEARASKYISYIPRSEVQEKLKGYSVNEYSYYDILRNKQNTPEFPTDNNLDTGVSLCQKFISYNNYQVNALKSFYEPDGSFTINATIEINDDVSFIVISGDRLSINPAL